MTAKHAHRWIIEAAAGPTSLGVCHGCDEQREFYNAIPDGDFQKQKRLTASELQEIAKAREEYKAGPHSVNWQSFEV